MPKKLSFRKVILWVFVILFLTYVFTHLKELDDVIDTLAKGSWRWLLLAAIAQAAFYLVFTRMTQLSFKVVEIERKMRELIPMVFGALFVNVLAPTAGNSGVILYADDAKKRQESQTKAVVGSLFSTVASYASFSLILIFAVIYLKSVNLLDYFEVIGALLFILPTTWPAVLMFTSVKKPALMEKLLNFFYRSYLKLTRLFKLKPKLKDDWPKEISLELKTAGQQIIGHKAEVLKVLWYAFLAHAINIVSLYLIFISFDVHVRYGALIAGYAFAEVVRVISPHPEGVGAVEAVMILLYSSFGVPPIDATAIAISFRALNFWFPLGLGFLYLQRLKSFSHSA